MRFKCEDCGLDMVLLERPSKCYCCGSDRIAIMSWVSRSNASRDNCEDATRRSEMQMRICIPTMENNGLDDRVSAHFGRAPTYTIVDPDSGEVEVVKNTGEHMGGAGKPSELVVGTGAKVVICSGVGPRAIDMLNSSGVEVYLGADGTVKEAVEMWRAGKLEKASHDKACKEHHH